MANVKQLGTLTIYCGGGSGAIGGGSALPDYSDLDYNSDNSPDIDFNNTEIEIDFNEN